MRLPFEIDWMQAYQFLATLACIVFGMAWFPCGCPSCENTCSVCTPGTAACKATIEFSGVTDGTCADLNCALFNTTTYITNELAFPNDCFTEMLFIEVPLAIRPCQTPDGAGRFLKQMGYFQDATVFPNAHVFTKVVNDILDLDYQAFFDLGGGPPQICTGPFAVWTPTETLDKVCNWTVATLVVTPLRS